MVGGMDDFFQFISIKLNGKKLEKNYLYWSDVMTNFLKSKNMRVILVALHINIKIKRMKNMQNC